MNLKTISEHTFDGDLLNSKSIIIDLGCRGFEFTNHFLATGAKVYSFDIDKFIGDYFHCGVSNYDGFCGINDNEDKQALTLNKDKHTTPCISLQTILYRFCKDNFCDLIKMDVEGSEYEIIMSLTEPPAKQLSIEFHLHTGIYGMNEMREMETRLYALGYEAILHNKTAQHGAGLNYWDSLFILK